MPHDDYVYGRIRERLEVEYDLDGRAAKSELGKLVKRVEKLEADKASPSPAPASAGRRGGTA
jgi:hypothetical protein